MEHHAVDNTCHGKLSDTEMHVSAETVFLREIACILHIGLVGRCKIGGTAHQSGDQILQFIDDHAGRCSGRLRLFGRCKEILRKDRVDIQCEMILPYRLHLGIVFKIRTEHLLPFSMGLCACLSAFSVVRIDLLGHIECFLILPAEILSERGNIFRSERLAVRNRLALLGRAAVADLGLHGDEGRTGRIRFCFFDRSADGSKIRTVFHGDELEAESFETLLDILGEGDIRAAFDGDPVGIIEDDQLAEAERAGQGHGFGGNAFHHAAVAAHDIGIMIKYRIVFPVEYFGQMCFGNRHADSHGKTCAKRAGRGFHACGMLILRMAGGQGTELTEALQILYGKIAVAEKMKE